MGARCQYNVRRVWAGATELTALTTGFLSTAAPLADDAVVYYRCTALQHRPEGVAVRNGGAHGAKSVHSEETVHRSRPSVSWPRDIHKSACYSLFHTRSSPSTLGETDETASDSAPEKGTIVENRAELLQIDSKTDALMFLHAHKRGAYTALIAHTLTFVSCLLFLWLSLLFLKLPGAGNAFGCGRLG